MYVFFINDKLFTENITGRDNTVRLEIPDGANYRLCTIDEINQLVNNYLLARTKADQTTLQRLVTDPSEFDDMKSIEIAAEYITAYNKTTCYIANGYTADSYIQSDDKGCQLGTARYKVVICDETVRWKLQDQQFGFV